MEFFDALDENGEKLGYQIPRGNKINQDVFIGIVTLVVVNDKKEVLVTRRAKNKVSGLQWEITGGGIQAGEPVRKAAVRELFEETGIKIEDNDLISLDVETKWPFVCNSFVVKLNSSPVVKLQAEETIAYRWLDLENFFQFVKRKSFVLDIGKRITNHRHQIVNIINNN